MAMKGNLPFCVKENLKFDSSSTAKLKGHRALINKKVDSLTVV